MEKSSKHSRAGFTLIELALAALLVGIGLVSLITLGRHAVRAALEVEDERRATALAEDLFATLRAASSDVYQLRGYEKCLEFWSMVTNSNREAIIELMDEMGGDYYSSPNTSVSPRLTHPAAYLKNAAMPEDDAFTFPFYQTAEDEPDYRFQPAMLWDARYNISIELKNFLRESFPDLPPDVVAVTVRIRPRTTHLKAETLNNETKQYTEYLTFFTHIPLEPLRQTLFGGLHETD